jgi:hypothetical protein
MTVSGGTRHASFGLVDGDRHQDEAGRAVAPAEGDVGAVERWSVGAASSSTDALDVIRHHMTGLDITGDSG